ncbi:MAG: serine/threonine-protein kinase [Planctomycetota bacterium]
MSTRRDFLGPFQLVRLIRQGTTSAVWEAVRTGEKERVALKLLLSKYQKDKKEIAAMIHEAEVGKEVRHPNVIAIFDYHTANDIPFVSMQLFPAKNLKIELRERPLYVQINIKQIVQKCAIGLAHMHEKGWVHCDVKPDNFLADEQGNVKLIDFAIALKMKKGWFGGARPKTIQGTRSYMSPEQIRRKSLDERADIYSLGCVIFELMSGRTPFNASNPDDLLNRHLNTTPPSLLSCSGATRDLSDLVLRMMEKNPANRPPTMNAFITEFQRIGMFRAGKHPKGMVGDQDI